jgi:hypothetical protein
MNSLAQILNIAGLICEFLVVLAIARRVFWRRERVTEDETNESAQSVAERIFSERNLQAWVLALMPAAMVFQIAGILLS